MKVRVLVGDQVVVALISGGAALIVAVVGVLGAIVAQLVATRRAFQTSLALFEKQEVARRQAWLEQIRREDLHRFAEHRRNTYSCLGRLADSLVAAREDERIAVKYMERKQRQLDRGGEPTPALLDDVDQQRRTAVDGADRVRRLGVELDDTADDVQILASVPVCEAAEELRDWANKASHRDAGEYRRARSTSLAAVRLELGIQNPRRPSDRTQDLRAEGHVVPN